jgi:hypothetical protein
MSFYSVKTNKSSPRRAICSPLGLLAFSFQLFGGVKHPEELLSFFGYYQNFSPYRQGTAFI